MFDVAFRRLAQAMPEEFMRVGAALREGALEALSPTRCASCERLGELICERCLNEMRPIDPRTACVRCGAPFGDMLCTECDSAEGPVARCLAATVFEGPPSRIIRAYKDGGERRLAPLIAALMLDAAEHAELTAPDRYGGILSCADAVTFVPVTAEAYRRRGFDHMEAASTWFATFADVPPLDALVKHGRSDQRKLGRAERLSQAGDLYEVVEDVRGMRLLVLDDVITTGATIGAVAAALRQAGAERVDALALARVW